MNTNYQRTFIALGQQVYKPDRTVPPLDIYVGPKVPAGFEKNWIPSVPGKAWFPSFHLYAPTEEHFNRTWILPDFVKMN